MERAKKKLNAIFSNNQTVKPELEVQEVLSSKQLRLSRLGRQGFPAQPRCLAWDGVQGILAVGQAGGAVRVLGKPGVDVSLQHETSADLLCLHFLVNEGALLTACKDDSLHLWNLRQRRPEIVHSLQFQKERIACLHVPFSSQWFYIGTERGNVHVASVATFELSGYVINWNKAIDLSQKTHPGPVRHLSECPGDEGKLLIAFEKGVVVLWDLKAKVADSRYCSNLGLLNVSWHYEGKSFVVAHTDGSLAIWNIKKGHTPKDPPATAWTPHSRGDGAGPGQGQGSQRSAEPCRPIPQIQWRHSKGGQEEFLIFSGGLAMDESGCLPGLTILRGGKSATVLEMEDSIVAFVCLSKVAYPNEAAEPYAVAVLLGSDLLIVDLETPGYPCFENPYPMDLHESPVTHLQCLADCPSELISNFYMAGKKQKRTGFVDKKWPVTGGVWEVQGATSQKILLSGHADGSLKFWDAASEQLQLLYKLKTGRHLERAEEKEVREMDPLAVECVRLCGDSLLLAVAGRGGQVSLFRFVRSEATAEVAVLEVPIAAPALEEERRGSLSSLHSEHSIPTSDGSKKDLFLPLKVRGGPLKRPMGYQPELVCLTPWAALGTPEVVHSLALNSAFQLMAYGTSQGIAIIDIAQHTVVLSITTTHLYPPGSEPQRASNPTTPKTPKVPTTPSATKVPSVERGLTEDEAASAASTSGKGSEEAPLERCKSSGGPLSRSSSAESWPDDNCGDEAVLVLEMVSAYTAKAGEKVKVEETPSLWLGTASGALLLCNLSLPSGTDRLGSAVSATHSGSLFRGRGGMLALAFMDASFSLLAPPSARLGKDGQPCREPSLRNKLVYRSKISVLSSSEEEGLEEAYAVGVWERGLQVLQLPSQAVVYSTRLDGEEHVELCKATVTTMAASPVVVGLSRSGRVEVFSLPSLRRLLDKPLVPSGSSLGGRSFCVSHEGAGAMMANESELEMLSLRAAQNGGGEAGGELFVGTALPEREKPGFFRGLLGGGGSNQVDRDELFGGADSGRASKSVARTMAGPGMAGISAADIKGDGPMAAVARTKLALIERSEKLSKVEDATAQMASASESYAKNASALVEKMKNKKWYQL